MRPTLIKVAVVAVALVSAAGAEGEAGLAQPVGDHAQHYLGGAGDDGQHHDGDLHERADDGVQHPALPQRVERSGGAEVVGEEVGVPQRFRAAPEGVADHQQQSDAEQRGERVHDGRGHPVLDHRGGVAQGGDGVVR